MTRRISGTALSWPYPLSSPSARFLRMNDFVRSLDVRYSAFSGARKKTWKDFADLFPWVTFCLDDIYDVPFDGFLAGTGVQAFRSINCSRLDCGLSVAVDPPTDLVQPAGDTLTLSVGAFGFYATWSGRTSSPVGSFVFDLRLWLGNSLPSAGPAVSKFRFQRVVSASYNSPVLVFPVPVDTTLPAWPARVVGVAVLQIGGSPFFAQRLPIW